MSFLRLEHLGLRRNDRWLFRGLELEVPPGRFLAVVGASGAGKSSLVACLAGQLPPDEGRVAWPAGGRPRVSVVFQQYFLCANASALTNVLCGRLARFPWWRTLWGFPRAEEHAAFHALAELGLAREARRPARLLSGGEQQRVAVARSLFQGPEVYLADEPVSNLDAYHAGRVLGLLRQEAREAGRTVICVLHDAALVERFADLVLALNPQDPDAWSLREVSHPTAATSVSMPA